MPFLLYSCGAFSPNFDSLETAVKKSRIPKANVLCRYGTDTLAHLSLMFVEMDQESPRKVSRNTTDQHSNRGQGLRVCNLA